MELLFLGTVRILRMLINAINTVLMTNKFIFNKQFMVYNGVTNHLLLLDLFWFWEMFQKEIPRKCPKQKYTGWVNYAVFLDGFEKPQKKFDKFYEKERHKKGVEVNI